MAVAMTSIGGVQLGLARSGATVNGAAVSTKRVTAGASGQTVSHRVAPAPGYCCSEFHGSGVHASSSSVMFNLERSVLNGQAIWSQRRPTRGESLVVRGLFGLGVPELAVIAGVAAILFGPKQLPEIGKSLGKTVKSFQQAAKEFESEVKAASSDEATTESAKTETTPTPTSPPPPPPTTASIPSDKESVQHSCSLSYFVT